MARTCGNKLQKNDGKTGLEMTGIADSPNQSEFQQPGATNQDAQFQHST